jgi:hypothetical protein
MYIQLTAADDKVRHRATLLLADLLSLPVDQAKPPPPPLEAAVVHLFVVFFCHRLSDYPSIIPSLQALTALISLHSSSFDQKYDDVLDIFQTVFKELDVCKINN